MKEKAIIVGPCIGEFYWEAARFASHIIWKRKVQYPDKEIKFIVMTRNDRYDLYGLHADKIVGIELNNQVKDLNQNGYRLDNFPMEQYKVMIDHFRSICEQVYQYEVIEHIYPDISKAQFCNREQYKKEEMVYEFLPRRSNKQTIDFFIKDKNPLVILAPRYRQNMKRNWIYWQELYNLIDQSDLKKDFIFLICGNPGSYTPDKNKRFLDINDFQKSPYTSLSGLLIEALKKAILTIGSQSAIPNLSLLFGTEVLEWGHQKQWHTVDYNVFNTPITFLDDLTYDIKPEIVFEQVQNILRRIRHVNITS